MPYIQLECWKTDLFNNAIILMKMKTMMKKKTMNLSHRPSPEAIQIVIIEIDAKNSSDLEVKKLGG